MNVKRSGLRLTPILAALFLIAAPSATSAAVNSGALFQESGSGLGGVETGRQAFLLKLDPASTSRVFLGTRSDEGARAARSAARSQKSRISSVQSEVAESLPADASVLYRTHSLMAGLAVTGESLNQAELEDLNGVSAVYPIAPKTPDNSSAMPLQGAKQAWTATGALGQGTSIAVIDTGIDYTHSNFGGPGTVSAYQEARANEADPADPDLFPNEKVVGGFDLVGDGYDADQDVTSTPQPDPNPLDCMVHGSHVAGTAAGYGENSDGSTFTGNYDYTTPFESMEIGPGMAPEADIYAFRIFGCHGSSTMATAALDKASDPDGNGDPSDHVDVVNMSLGSDFGSADDGDSVAANAAVGLGITVAVSAGNGGDVTDISGSPGNASRAITVANTQDADSRVDGTTVTIDGSQSTFAALRSGNFNWSGPEDLTGTVVLPPANNQTACTGYPANTFSGQVVLVKWTQAALECGSAQRGGNLADAGAGGFIFANSEESFSAGILGSPDIPGVLMSKSGADQIRAALESSLPVTVDRTEINGAVLHIPEDNNKVADSSSRGIHATGNVKPDVAAVGTSVFSTASGTGHEGMSLTGTSMAAPMVAGLAALVHEQNPGWTPLQVKADIMNTAGQDVTVNGAATPAGDRYAPVRVGAGRIMVEPALKNRVLAFNPDDGSVSVSFGPVEVDAPMTLSRDVTVQNNGTSDIDYSAAYDEITSVPGVSYEVSPENLTVTAGGARTVTVTFRVDDPGEMTKTVDPTIGREYGPGDPRETLSEASGNLVLEPAQTFATPLRVPVYSAPRPAADMSQPASLNLSGDSDQTVNMGLTGNDLGSGGKNGLGTPDPADDIFSIAAGFELQATSGEVPACTELMTSGCYRVPEDRAADIKFIGVSSNYPQIGDPSTSLAFFAVSTHGAWSTPAGKTAIVVDIDVNGDNTPDLFLVNQRRGQDDVFYAQSFSPHERGQAVPINDRTGDIDTALYDSDSMILPLRLDDLAGYGINPSNPRITYGVETYSSSSPEVIDTIGVDPESGLLDSPMSADLFNPGIRVTDTGGAETLLPDKDGSEVSIHRDVSSYGADRGEGLLMLHLHNKVGDKAQVVALSKLSQVITFGPDQGSANLGEKKNLVATGGGSSSEVTFSTSTPDRCEVDGIVVSFVGAGTCTVEADQEGDATYARATTASHSFEVAKASSTTSVRVGPGSVNATVEGLGDVGVKPTGAVSFLVDGTNIGNQNLTDGTASLSIEVPAGGNRHVVASYAGDSNFEPSDDSTERQDPRISAAVSSSGPSNSRGWYRTPVTVTFTCEATTAAIFGGCPAPVTLTGSGKDQTVTRTVAAEDGGIGAAKVDGIDIDRIKPKVKIKGVRKGKTYRKKPKARCVARDPVSGVRSCRISRRRKGKTVTYKAKATDRAGNVKTVKKRIRVS